MSNLVEIALSQYGVKEIAGENDNQTIVGYAKEAGHTWVNDDETPWCLDGNIEVLTSDGFIKLNEISKKIPSKVAMVDSNEFVQFTNIFGIVEKSYNGIAKKITSGNMNIICDPDHEFYGKCDGSYRFKKKKIKDITNSGIGIPPIKSSQSDFDISDELLKLLAIYISDGRKQFNLIYVGVSKERKKNFMNKMDTLKIKEDSKTWGNRKLRTRYSFRYPIIFDNILLENKIPKWDFIMKLSQRQCKLFIDTYLLFDGNGINEVYSQWKETQEILHYVATMAGYKSSQYSTKQVSKNTKIEYLHSVYISKNKNRYITKKGIENVKYNDVLYCLTVPSGKIVVRDLNGTIYQTGNCSIFMDWCAMKAGVERTHKANARSWLDVGEKTDNPQTGDIVIFKRGNNTWSGHVAIYIAPLTVEHGKTDLIYVLGGNQSNEVKISLYDSLNVLGYRKLRKI
jgi:uncharacterized protein (TIGR02594 family)